MQNLELILKHKSTFYVPITLRPGVNPSDSRSTMKAVKALLAGAFGSGLVLTRTKYLLIRIIRKNF